MANLTETEARVTVTLTRDVPGGANHVAIQAETATAEGERVRRWNAGDIYDQLSATRQAQVAAILDDVLAFVKNRLSIP